MIDDVATEPRRRVSPNDNYLRGFGRENDFTGASLHFSNHDQLVAIKAMEEEREWRLADELTVMAIGANHTTDYSISLLAAIGTAKKGAKAKDMTPMVELALSKWQTTGAEAARGPIASIAKDGASIMNASVFSLCTEHEIDRSSAVGRAIFGDDGKGSVLFFDRCGRSPQKPLTDTVDDKHWGKRFRQALGRPEGVTIKQFTFTKALVSRLLKEMSRQPTRYDDSQIKTMFGDGEADSQNVDALTKLLFAIGELRYKSAADFDNKDRINAPQFAKQLAELHVLSWYAGTAFEVITMQSSNPMDPPGTFLSLGVYDTSVSRLAHLAFVLFRQNAGHFVPPQNYYNTQICLRTKYTSQALSKAMGIPQYWPYQDADDREEQLFGQLRVLQHGQNFDIVQFEDRASELMSLDSIYARHPEWKKGSRRLTGMCFDHVNPKTILANNASAVDLSNVGLTSCWFLGGVQARNLLLAGSVFDATATNWAAISQDGQARGSKIDMLRPNGEYVGVDAASPTPAARHPNQTDEEEWMSWLDLEDELEDELEHGDGAVGASGAHGDGSNAATAANSSERRRTLRYPHPQFPNGITASKDVGLLWSTNKRVSVERINRVQQRPKAGTSGADGAWTEERAEILAHVTPLLAILDSPLGATLVVIMPQQFELRGQKGLDCIAASDLLLDTTVVHGQVMQPISMASGEEGSATVTDLVFRHHTLRESMKICALLTRPCDPDQSISPEGVAEWKFPVLSLEVLMTLAWTDIEQHFYRQGQTRRDGQQLLPALRKESIYVQRSSQSPLFIVEGTGRAASDPAPPKQHATASEINVACELCSKVWPSTEIQQHMGGHLLEDSWSRYKQQRPAFPCGICGVRESVGQHLVEPLSFAGCSVYIKDGKAFHQCKLASDVSYSLSTAQKMSYSSRPCTNRPVKCTCGRIIQSYSMEDHWRQKHAGMAMDQELRKAVQLRPHEREYTMNLVTMRSNKTKLLCNNPECECKK